MLHTTINILSLIIAGIASVRAQSMISTRFLSVTFPGPGMFGCYLMTTSTDGIRSDCRDAQVWLLLAGLPPSRPLQIRPASNPRLCLDAIDVNTDNKVQLLECSGSPAQLWLIIENGDGPSFIKSPFGGRCINVVNNEIVSIRRCSEPQSGWVQLRLPLLTSQNLD